MTSLVRSRRRWPGRPLPQLLWWDTCRFLATLLLQMAFGLRVTGRSRVPRTGPLLYLSNHQSYLDPMISAAAIRDRPCRPFARETLFRGPLGLLIRSLGALPVRGGGGDKAIMRAALEELDAGRCVLVYPEGSRTFDGGLAPFKSGIALLLKRSSAMVVPLGIEGAYDAFPRTTGRPRFRRQIEVEVGEPIPAADLLVEGVPAGLARLEDEIDGLRRRCRDRLRRRCGPGHPSPGVGDGPTPVRRSGSTGAEEA